MQLPEKTTLDNLNRIQHKWYKFIDERYSDTEAEEKEVKAKQHRDSFKKEGVAVYSNPIEIHHRIVL